MTISKQGLTQRMKSFLTRFVSDQRGDSLAEVLVAILIAAIGALLLATMVSASVNVATSSKDALSSAYEAESTVVGASPDNDKATISISVAGGSAFSYSVDVKVYASGDGSLIRYESASDPEDGA